MSRGRPIDPLAKERVLLAIREARVCLRQMESLVSRGTYYREPTKLPEDEAASEAARYANAARNAVTEAAYLLRRRGGRR